MWRTVGIRELGRGALLERTPRQGEGWGSPGRLFFPSWERRAVGLSVEGRSGVQCRPSVTGQQRACGGGQSVSDRENVEPRRLGGRWRSFAPEAPVN